MGTDKIHFMCLLVPLCVAIIIRGDELAWNIILGLISLEFVFKSSSSSYDLYD